MRNPFAGAALVPVLIALVAGCAGGGRTGSTDSADSTGLNGLTGLTGLNVLTGLTKEETAIITRSDSLMRVLSVFDREDSLALRRVSVDFTDADLRSEAFRTLCSKMLYTVQDPSQDGVGIAAPQVGLSRRLVAVQRYDLPGEPFGIFPNARLDSLWGDVVPGREGCLSVPGRAGMVPRFTHIRVSYKDPATLQTVREEVEGFTAVIFQHEIDHLDGVIYTDRADSLWITER